MAQALPDTLDEFDEAQRRALETLMVSMADDEFVIAERYTEWQVRAPSLESDLALSNIAQDELGHARLWYDVLDELGYGETDLLYERDPTDFRHATLCELPFTEGDWADAIVRTYLYDVAEELRLEALADSAYQVIAHRVPKVSQEETYHRQHAETWLARLAEDDEGVRRLQDALDRLFAHALTLFQPATPPAFGRHDEVPGATETEAIIVESGLRPVTLEDLANAWLDIVTSTLEGYDLTVPLANPMITDTDLPEVTGRSGEHTDDWFELYDEFTFTYRDLGRTHTERIMPKPDDD